MRERPGGTSKTRPVRAWLDVRLAIGVGLVIASIIGVYSVVSASDTTVTVLAAASALVPGDTVHAGDLVEEAVRLGESDGNYLRPEDVPAEGVVIVRTVGAGELVPVAAVGAVAGLRVASIVVTVSGGLPGSVASGSVVDLWSASQTEHDVFGPPAVLVASATVVRVIEPEGLVAQHGSSDVEVLVPRSRVARMLDAIANGDRISLIPTSIPAGRE